MTLKRLNTENEKLDAVLECLKYANWRLTTEAIIHTNTDEKGNQRNSFAISAEPLTDFVKASEVGSLLLLKGYMPIENSDIGLILSYLESEKYCESKIVSKDVLTINFGSDNFYKITYLGKIFIENGGYLAKQNKDVQEQIKVEKLNTLELRLKQKAIVQNRWIIALGIVAGAYAFIQICKELHLLWYSSY